MAVYFANTEITGIKDLFPLSSKDITGLYFADTELFTVWGEYDDTLTAQFNANGSALADYRVYGSAGGVGDKTVNIFNAEVEQGNLYAGEIQPPTSENYYKRCRTKDYVHVPSGNTITVKSQYDLWVYCYSNTTYVSSYGSQSWSKKFTFTIPPGINNIKIMFANDDKTSNLFISDFVNDVMIVRGSTAHAEYVPYGYEVDMSVSDGTTSNTILIYIGDPLEEDEYVSFKERKVYRRTENLWNGVWRQGNILSVTGESDNDPYFVHTGHMPCQSLTNLAIKYFGQVQSGADVRGTIAYYDSNDDFIVAYTWGLTPFSYSYITKLESVEIGAAYVALSFAVDYNYIELSPETAAPLLVTGSDTIPTADTQYIPYLQPTDPPVSLPALPTVDGTNIVDYAGQSVAVPSRFYAKYRKEGFK